MTPRPRIGITLGDPAGVGPEVVVRALMQSRVQRAGELVLFGAPEWLDAAAEGVGLTARQRARLPLTWQIRLPFTRIRRGRPSPASGQAALHMLQHATAALQQRQIDLLVTAPASKAAVQSAGHWFPGHTEWLAKQFSVRDVGMLLVADGLRVMLVTRHLPMRRVAQAITRARVRTTLNLCVSALRDLLGIARPRIAVASLNPHAGESGTLGREEIEILRPVIRAACRRGLRVVGPIAPDALFAEASDGRYDAVIAMYHDQGLIPLKLLGRDTGVNMTVGLPCIRTAPDHGTAYDIASQFRAHPGAMASSVLLAAEMWRRTHR